jgi:hypothetical protein
VSTFGDSEPQIVWTLRDQQSLERELVRIYGDAFGRDAWLSSVVDTLSRRLQDHPREWPTASISPSHHIFRFYGVEIRSRVFPADETVEVPFGSFFSAASVSYGTLSTI